MSGDLLHAGRLPLFPLHAVLFPGGILPLRIFEQRYITMVKACIAQDSMFGVCLIMKGDEVMRDAQGVRAPEFAPIGTAARIVEWDMPQLGILHLRTEGVQRFSIDDHCVAANGLVQGTITPLAAEPSLPVPENFAPLARLLELMATRVGPQHFAFHEKAHAAPRGGPSPRRTEHDYGNASWLGYRLAELLPLPLNIKQSMLEINDSEVRLSVLMRFLADQGLL